jgi:fatty acid desaturase
MKKIERPDVDGAAREIDAGRRRRSEAHARIIEGIIPGGTALTITDPVHRPRTLGAVEARLVRFINDERDLAFLRLAFLQSLIILPVAAWLYAHPDFPAWIAVPYWGLVLVWWLAPYILMLHNTSHRRLFRKDFDWLNAYIPVVLGPFFGETPETYFAHHVGMHHPENNLRDDLSSTLEYQRDSFIDFLRYFGRFFFGIIVELPVYFYRRGRYGLMRRALTGELGYLLAVAVLAWWRLRPTVVLFIVPFMFTRFMMMVGNWGQHAFIDLSAPDNCYRNSITCVNASYNRRCFNDGYHIGHHLKPTLHWMEMPGDFQDNLPRYVDEGAIVFAGIDFFIVWALLMLKRYDWLARRVVVLDGVGRSEAEVVAMLRERTRRADPAPLAVAA